jgi:hypothetical protein
MAADPSPRTATPTWEGHNCTRAYELTMEARVVARLFEFAVDATGVRVAAEIYPINAAETNEPQWRFYDLSPQQAANFVHETLLALEYLGCCAAEINPSRGSSAPRAVAAA